MKLSREERAMLRGNHGEPVRRALELQLEVGRFYGAQLFVPVTNVHMMGDIEVMGDSGLEFLHELVAADARCAVPTSTTSPTRLASSQHWWLAAAGDDITAATAAPASNILRTGISSCAIITPQHRASEANIIGLEKNVRQARRGRPGHHSCDPL